MSDAFDLERMLRPDLRGLAAYKPGKSIYALSAELGIPVDRLIKIDANENPYGSSPKVYEALAAYRRYHCYPDADQADLRQALAGYVGLPVEQIVAGNGSDELIDLTLKLFLTPGDVMLNCPPTFGVYAFAASMCGAEVVDIPRRDDFSLDIDAIERGLATGALSRAKAIVITSPNNPDGNLPPAGEIARLLALPLLVILDEAYIEFSGGSLSAWVSQHPNLIVLRTFSKWLGLAGLRVGYGLYPPAIAQHIWKIKPPFNVNVAAQVAAIAALDDMAYFDGIRDRLVAERERLLEALRGIPYLRPYPSQTNFVLVRVAGRGAAEVAAGLERRGILVRKFREPELADALRFTVGKPEQMAALVSALLEME